MKRDALKPKILTLMRNANMSMYAAIDAVGIAPSTAFRWRQSDGQFQRQIEEQRIVQRAERRMKQTGYIIDRIRESFAKEEDDAEEN